MTVWRHALLAAAALAAGGCALVDELDKIDTSASAASSPSSVATTASVIPGCESDDPEAVPSTLACTGLYADFGAKTVAASVRTYAPAVAFWSDGAEKTRFIQLPDGATIDTSDADDWNMPVGTKAWKELRRGDTRVETRFFWKVRANHWVSAVYVWKEDGSAERVSGGANLTVAGAAYHVPKDSDCSECHKGKTDKLLGFEAVSLGLPGASGVTLAMLADEGRLSAKPAKTSFTIPDDGHGAPAALPWLHTNCGTSCHNGNSSATAYGSKFHLKLRVKELEAGTPIKELDLYTSAVSHPVHSPNWPGGLRIVPGDPDASLVVQLAGSRGQDQMPPIATDVVDEQGMALVKGWIAGLPRVVLPGARSTYAPDLLERSAIVAP